MEVSSSNPLTDARFLSYEATGNTLGNIRGSGDGPKFKGAGAIQIAGRTLYKLFSEYIGDSQILSDAALYAGQKYFWEVAGFFWSVYKPATAAYAIETIPGSQLTIFSSQSGGANKNDLNGKCDGGASVFDITDIVYGDATDPDCHLQKKNRRL